jgi:son of sevenless
MKFQTISTIKKLQAVACSDGGFRAMREALRSCKPPCIPFLGMYLMDLSHIEEELPDFTPEGFLNLGKEQMVIMIRSCS